MSTIGWDEPENRSIKSQEGDFYKLKPGRHYLRFFGIAKKYLAKPFAKGEKRKTKHLAHAIVNGQVRVIDMPKGLFGKLCQFVGAGRDVAGPSAPEYIIASSGEGLSRRYTVMAGDEPKPIDPKIDVEKFNAKLLRLAETLEGEISN